ncbi:MAG: DNA-binding response regulator [Bacteroidetes bacterium]|nr:MAG: DNA-binding response regulator [Bacteroidota bacterium]
MLNAPPSVAVHAETITVVMADDHEIFRDGFRLTLSRTPHIKMIAEAANGEELVELVRLYQPHVVITDIKMPRMDGVAATRKISAEWPTIGIIGLSMFDEEELILEMLEAGALGYLLKNADKSEVIDAIDTVYMGRSYYCHTASNRLAHAIARSKINPHSKVHLTDFNERDLEVIRMICEEKTNKDIADTLFVSVRTVEGYRLRIMEKMHVKNTVGMVVFAIRNKLYTPPAGY